MLLQPFAPTALSTSDAFPFAWPTSALFPDLSFSSFMRHFLTTVFCTVASIFSLYASSVQHARFYYSVYDALCRVSLSSQGAEQMPSKYLLNELMCLCYGKSLALGARWPGLWSVCELA